MSWFSLLGYLNVLYYYHVDVLNDRQGFNLNLNHEFLGHVRRCWPKRRARQSASTRAEPRRRSLASHRAAWSFLGWVQETGMGVLLPSAHWRIILSTSESGCTSDGPERLDRRCIPSAKGANETDHRTCTHGRRTSRRWRRHVSPRTL